MPPPVDELLAKSCGQMRPISLVASLHHGQKATKFVIEKPYAIIGRHAQCDISLPYPDISVQHAYLQVLDGRLFCVDMHSRKWIFWKDKPRLYGWLDADEWIRIGPYTITLEQPVGETRCRAHGAPNTKPFLTRYKTPSTSEAQLVLQDQQILPLQSQLTTIGKSKYCNLELEEEGLSRVHASIVRTNDGKYWIIDLKSRLGLKVNGHRCQSALLNHHDTIAIGSYTFAFQVVPKESVRKSVNEHKSVASPDPVTSQKAVTEPAEVMISSARISVPVNQPLLLPHTPTSSSAIVVSEHRFDEHVLPTPETPNNTQLVAASSTSLVKSKANIFIAPHIKLTRSAPQVTQQASSRETIDDFGLMDGLMQCMKQMQQEMMTQMRMNIEMMGEFMKNLQQQQMSMIREELAELGKLNKELLELRQSLLTTTPPDTKESNRQSPSSMNLPANGNATTDTAPGRDTHVELQKKHKAPPTPSMGKDGPPIDSHVWISKRIAILEKERQSKWEKMKSAVMGR